jgi:hypothetical protein
MDTLSAIVVTSQRLIDGSISLNQFKSEFGDSLRDMSEEHALSLAHVISEYAIHLRDAH